MGSRRRRVGVTARPRVLLSTRVNYDDIVLLVGLIKSYVGAETQAADVWVSGDRSYTWDDLDLFVEQCPRLGRATMMVVRVCSDSKKVEIDFRRRTTRLVVTGADAHEARRYQRHMAAFLMSARPRRWPSYKLFFETPKVTAVLAFTLLLIGYLFNREFILYTVLLAGYVASNALWLNPTRIIFKDGDQLRADAAGRMQRLVITPLSVVGGLLGIVSTGIVIAGHLH